RHRKPQTMHVRSLPYDNGFARWQFRVIEPAVDHLVFITENEREAAERLLGHGTRGSVIYNIAPKMAAVAPRPGIPADGRLKIAMLSNFDLVRGTDRIAEVADCL